MKGRHRTDSEGLGRENTKTHTRACLVLTAGRNVTGDSTKTETHAKCRACKAEGMEAWPGKGGKGVGVQAKQEGVFELEKRLRGQSLGAARQSVQRRCVQSRG